MELAATGQFRGQTALSWNPLSTERTWAYRMIPSVRQTFNTMCDRTVSGTLMIKLALETGFTIASAISQLSMCKVVHLIETMS